LSSEELPLSELIKEIRDLYHNFQDMLTTKYSFSPRNLIRELDSWVRNREEWRSSDEEKKSSYYVSYYSSLSVLDFYRDYVLSLIVKAFDSLIDIESKISKLKAENLINLLTQPLNGITNKVINDWFVKTSRKSGSIEANLFDNYNMFKEKWNSLLNEVEVRMGRLGLEVRIDERAKDSNVPVV